MLLIGTLIVSLAASAPKGPAVENLAGAPVRPLALARGKPLALVFITHDCPICNAYAPELARIARTYAKRGVRFDFVYTEQNLSRAAAKAHAKAYGYAGLTLLLDPHAALAKYAGAGVTPEAAVYDGARRLAYLGRVDNLYVSFGERRNAATTHDLRSALDAVLGHKPVSPTRTTPVGCFINPS